MVFIRLSHHIQGIKKLIIVLLLLKNVDFVFLLLARHSSNTFGSPLARASVLMIYTTHHHMIYTSA